MALSSMIIDDFNVVGISPAEFEADAPRPVHCHGPLPLAVAFELVESDTLERTQIAKSHGDVQRQQQVDGGAGIQPTELVRSLAVSDLAARRVAP